LRHKKIPLRTCVVTHERLPKKELIRVVKNKENEVFVDLTGKKNGRGAYVKRDLEVIEQARKTKVLDKHLETNVPEEIYDELVSIVNENLVDSRSN
jgi:predicted RNA-binding protein YlxR (DUF448 family)